MKPTIEITIAPTGEITIDAMGFKGADCEQATRYLEAALGVTTHRAKKPEYHQQQRNKKQQRIST
jgi:DUF2997 family protein